MTPLCLFSSATSNFAMISATYSGVTLVIWTEEQTAESVINLSSSTVINE